MSISKIAVSLDEKLVDLMDKLVIEGKYKSRSSIIQSALEDKLKARKPERPVKAPIRKEPKSMDIDQTDEFLNLFDEESQDY